MTDAQRQQIIAEAKELIAQLAQNLQDKDKTAAMDNIKLLMAKLREFPEKARKGNYYNAHEELGTLFGQLASGNPFPTDAEKSHMKTHEIKTMPDLQTLLAIIAPLEKASIESPAASEQLIAPPRASEQPQTKPISNSRRTASNLAKGMGVGFIAVGALIVLPILAVGLLISTLAFASGFFTAGASAPLAGSITLGTALAVGVAASVGLAFVGFGIGLMVLGNKIAKGGTPAVPGVDSSKSPDTKPLVKAEKQPSAPAPVNAQAMAAYPSPIHSAPKRGQALQALKTAITQEPNPLLAPPRQQ